MRFSENLNLPILQDGDKYSKEIQNEAFNTIDRECTNIKNTIKTALDINDDVIGSIKTLGNISEELSDLKEKQNEDYYELLESNNYIGEKISDIDSQLETKASLQECKEEIAKAQLEGAGVDTSNFVVQSDIEKVMDIKYTENYDYTIVDGMCCWKSGLVQSGISNSFGVKINVVSGEKYIISGVSANSNLPLAVFKSVDNLKAGNVVSFVNNEANTLTTYTDLEITVPDNAIVMYLNSTDKSKIAIKIKKIKKLSVIVNEMNDNIKSQLDNFWENKKIVWFGTSIPAGGAVGSYVWELEKRLGCKIYNEAIGSSAVRAGCHAKITSDDTMGWKGCAFPNIAYALSGTLAEKEEIINNYSKYGWNVNLDDTHKQYIRNCSYERKLTKYLTGGSVGRCDLYVFDHGHNDCLTWNEGIDEMSVIPSDKKDRTYFIGAMNFLIDLILKDNPKAKIVFIGHYESDRKKAIYQAQNVLHSIWGFPMFKTWEHIGWNQNKITLKKDWVDGILTDTNVDKEFTITKTWMADDLHPHSDLSGQAIQKYADILEPWFRYTLK